MQEAGCSLTVKIIDKLGMSNLVTFRAEKAAEWTEVLKARGAFIEAAIAAGWEPHIEGARSIREIPAHQQGQLAPAQNGAHQEASSGDNVFLAEILTIEFNPKDGKKVAKLKGGRWAKHGVRLWPEAAATLGFDLDAMDAGEHRIQPINVRYVVNEAGQPSKVTGRAA